MNFLSRATATALVLAAASTAFAAEKVFDPTRDAAKDLAAAEAQAKAEHKRILMDVGGNWCVWCLAVDRTLNTDPELHVLLEKNYIVLRVNYSKENENKAFLAPYPKPTGFPQWYVLAADGKLIRTEDTSELEATHKIADGYNREALKKFFAEYAPK